jgi:hypothetical protein
MSDERARLRLSPVIACAGVSLFLLACDPPKAEGESAEAAQPVEGLEGPLAPKAAPQPMLKAMGPKGRRVKVIVLPGSASVEVEGLAARRRDGVIELTGKVGESRRLRVMDAGRQLELDVTIEEGGASPAVVDLDALPRAGRAL